MPFSMMTYASNMVGDGWATDMPNSPYHSTTAMQGKAKALFPHFPSNKVAFQSCQQLKIFCKKHNDCSLQEMQ